jgi:hypothetical protein
MSVVSSTHRNFSASHRRMRFLTREAREARFPSPCLTASYNLGVSLSNAIRPSKDFTHP